MWAGIQLPVMVNIELINVRLDNPWLTTCTNLPFLTLGIIWICMITYFPQEFANFAAEAEQFDHPQPVIIIQEQQIPRCFSVFPTYIWITFINGLLPLKIAKLNHFVMQTCWSSLTQFALIHSCMTTQYYYIISEWNSTCSLFYSHYYGIAYVCHTIMITSERFKL